MSAFGTYGFPAGNVAYQPQSSGFTYSYLAAAGSQTIRIPIGIYYARVNALGAGGAGGTQSAPATTALKGGGGGGGFSQGTFRVIPGQIFNIIGGAAPAGTSSFGALVSASGGSSATVAGLGGAGGTGSGGDISFVGGAGAAGNTPIFYQPEIGRAHV
jgi:hypothetical protein